MKNTWDCVLRCLSLSVVFAIATHPSLTAAASLISLGHAAGAQCGASDVNDTGVVAGSCKPGNTSGSLVAWVSIAGTETTLSPLAMGRSCQAGGVTNSGAVIGGCLDAGSVPFAVTWSSASPGSAPIKLAPLPGLLGLGADVSTFAGAYNQSGVVAGQSVGGNGNSTAVIWRPGSGTPVQVSASGDNCAAVDIVDSTGSGNPIILLNCPSGTGTITPKVARATGLLGAYVTTALAKNGVSSYCKAISINSGLQVLGTCILPAAPYEKAAFWTSSAAVALVLTVPDFPGDAVGKRNIGLYLNNLGHVIFAYQMSDGRYSAGYSDRTTAPSIFIPPLHAGATVSATGFGDNDLVVVAGENSNDNVQAAIFNPASPLVVTPVPLFGGGATSILGTVSKTGSYAVGVAVDSSHGANAVVTTLP